MTNLLKSAPHRKRLRNRRASSTFEVEVGGLHYVATVSRFDDGRLAEVFIGNHKSNSGADVNARDCGIVCSIALQFGADVATIQRALSRDSHNRPSGVLAAVLDIIAEGER
jgi:ribonucleoside-diphosphate reductase alpha chain